MIKAWIQWHKQSFIEIGDEYHYGKKGWAFFVSILYVILCAMILVFFAGVVYLFVSILVSSGKAAITAGSLFGIPILLGYVVLRISAKTKGRSYK